jgi:hypothetical protein
MPMTSKQIYEVASVLFVACSAFIALNVTPQSPLRAHADLELDFLDAALVNSPTFAAMKGRTPFASYFFFGERCGDGWKVEIGENMETHFARQESLKIFPDGTILKQADEIGLEEGWVVDYAPLVLQNALNSEWTILHR